MKVGPSFTENGRNEMDRESEAVSNLRRLHHFKYQLVGEGIIIGLLTGFVISAFRLLLLYMDEQRGRVAELARGGVWHAVAALAVMLLIACAVTLLLRWEPEISGSGIPQVEGELRGQKNMTWYRVLIGKFAGCALAIGGGLALGREGPSIQLGAMVGKGFAKCRKSLLTEERMLMTCGAGAGLAAAFGAPLAGALFALEELHRNFSIEVLVSTMGAAVAAEWVTVNIFGVTPVFNINVNSNVPINYYWAVLLLGVILGFAGILYNRTIDLVQDCFDRLGRLGGERCGTLVRMLAVFTVAWVAMLVYPAALGSGSWLVSDISEGGYMLAGLAVLLLVKFAYSAVSFGSGSPGGIFLPLLVLGAIIGGAYANVLTGLFGVDQSCYKAFTVLAMAGLFAAIVRAPVTGVILLTEMTGDFRELLSIVTVALVAYVVADMFGGEPIYTQLLHRQLRLAEKAGADKKVLHGASEKVVIREDVYIGSEMDGKQLSELGLLPGNLVVAVIRDTEERIPSGRSRLKGGDTIEVLCRKADIEEVERILEEKCKTIRKG